MRSLEGHFSERGGGTEVTGPTPDREALPPAGGSMSASAGNGRTDTASLLRSIAADLSTLITKQIELAKQELGEMV
ncbi:MAG TPA: hypothetical protein VFQ40_07050, partial [Actinomycetota bacterium]|nr:hypothetical protein [Actinomycetota bacterium]